MRTFKNNIILFIFIFFLGFAEIFSQEKTLPSIFLGTIQNGSGIDKEKAQEIQNKISLAMHANDKKEYSIQTPQVKEETLNRVKGEQQIGICEDDCTKALNSAFKSDYQITGTISKEASKFRLDLKLLKFSNSELKSHVERTFTQNQMEYYIKHLTYSLLDSKYTIDDSNAPPEIELGHVDLTKISIKEVKGSDLKIIEFKESDDDEINNITNSIKPILNDGDRLFNEKKYAEALINYNAIIDAIKKRVRSEKQSQFTAYVEDINKRIEQANTNYFSAKITNLDNDLNKELISDEAEDLVLKYDNLLKEYEKLPIKKNKEIINGLLERIEKIDISNYSNLEKFADSYYEKYKFTLAIRQYKEILNKLSKKPSTKNYKDYKERLNKKIEITRTTGTSFINSKLGNYLNIARTINVTYGVFQATKRDKEASELAKIIRDALLGAKNILKSSEFADERMLKEYNDLVRKINKDNYEFDINFGSTLDRSKLRSGEIETEGIDYPFFHFPGVPQRDRELLDKKNGSLKSSTLLYGSYASLVVMGLGAVLYQTSNASYSSTTGTLPVLYYYLSQSESTPGFGFLLLGLDQAKFNSAFSKVESASGMVNTGAGLFGIFVLLSHLDLLTTTKSVDTLGKLDGIPLYQLERGGFSLHARNQFISPIPRTGMETQYSLEYNYRF